MPPIHENDKELDWEVSSCVPLPWQGLSGILPPELWGTCEHILSNSLFSRCLLCSAPLLSGSISYSPVSYHPINDCPPLVGSYGIRPLYKSFGQPQPAYGSGDHYWISPLYPDNWWLLETLSYLISKVPYSPNLGGHSFAISNHGPSSSTCSLNVGVSQGLVFGSSLYSFSWLFLPALWLKMPFIY